MKIAIMSDSHDQWDNMQKAITISNDAGCEVLLFAGDFIAPPGIKYLEQFHGLVKFVWGNNEGEKVALTRIIDASQKMELAGEIFEGEFDGVRVFMNHYPRIAELAALSGKFDVCIFGHTHEYTSQKVGACLLINPGEIQGYKTGKPGFVIFDTNSQSFDRIHLK